MGYEGSSRNNLVETTNQLFENATDAELAARDVDPWEPDTGDGNLKGSSRQMLCNMAERVDEPQAVLVLELVAGQRLKSITLSGSAVLQCAVRPDEAARLLSFPWVVPVGSNTSFDQPNGLLMLEQTGVVRDKLRLTNAMRVRYGAAAAPVRPRPRTSCSSSATFMCSSRRLRRSSPPRLRGHSRRTCRSPRQRHHRRLHRRPPRPEWRSARSSVH